MLTSMQKRPTSVPQFVASIALSVEQQQCHWDLRQVAPHEYSAVDQKIKKAVYLAIAVAMGGVKEAL